jgi:hypothetical protein
MADFVQRHRAVICSSISESFSVNMTLDLERTLSTPLLQCETSSTPALRIKVYVPLDLK